MNIFSKMTVGGVLFSLLFVVGCAGPKVITASTSRKDTVKFLYQQGWNSGVVRCKMAKSGGHLSDCQEMALKLND